MQPTWIQSGLSTVPDRAVLPAVQVIVGNNQLRSAMKRIDSRPSPRPHHVTFPDLKPVTDPYHEVDDKEDAPRPAPVSETIQDKNSREIDLGLTSTPSPQNSALTEPVQKSAPRSGYSTPYPFPTGRYFFIAQRPWISGNPSSEYLRPPPCFSRPVPENMEERRSCFPSTKFISIDTVVTDDIDRIGFTAFKHDVGFGDWCEFIMDISPVIRAQWKNPDPREEDLRLVINNWNDQFFSKRGLHMAFVTVSESPGYQHAIILCDATDPRPSSWGTVPLPSASKYTQAPSRPLLSLLEYMLHEADVSRGAHEVPTSSVLAPDITSTSPLLSGNDKNTALEGPSTLPEASTPGTSLTMGDPSSPLVVPDALPIPFIEKEHKRFTRPVPDDLGSQPNFKTTRILSLNQGELKPINPLHASSRRDINSEDWGDFFKDIDGVVTQNSESNITTDIGKYYKDQLLPLLKSWNGQFFLKRGVQVICCTQYTRRGPLRSENFALYLRDIKPAARLAQGEFDSEEFMKVEILVDNAEDDDENFGFIPRGRVL
ncbi:hypothetical protein BDN72DRAFT_682936 [Pluteus cervinus]|uniref:Uncharacterized protein n=1 Tax=Pluteus cervinus TaxID=181527 RepID=A0ACD3ATR6_9AGAR|nr:hypothetical protein BDN72DRAFT_682936 [Pluteus cervinus]